MKERKSIARVDVPVDGPPPLQRPHKVGTGALVGERLVLTALHVVADEKDNPDELKQRIELTFPGKTVGASIIRGMWNREEDWVLLQCDQDPDAPALTLGELREADVGEHWSTYAFPEVKDDGFPLSGSIELVRDSYKKAEAIALSCPKLGGHEDVFVQGASGAPILVKGIVVGLIRSGIERKNSSLKVETIYACPTTPLLDKADPKLRLKLRDPLRQLRGVTALPTTLEPYLGLKRYTESDWPIFFGRSREIEELHAELDNGFDGKPIILLCGLSGVGKSSLIEAGLIPRLRLSKHVRSFRYESGGSLRELLDDATNGDWLAVEKDTKNKKPLIVILDQVEEAFTRARSRESAKAEFEEFVKALVRIFGQANNRPQGKLVLGFRSEWLARIQDALKHGQLPYNTYLLKPIARDGITEAVSLGNQKSLLDWFDLSIGTGLAEEIAHHLSSGPVDLDSSLAPTLQLVLRYLWDETDEEHAKGSTRHLTLERFEELKMKGTHLSQFIDRAISGLPPPLARYAATGLVDDLLWEHVIVHEVSSTTAVRTRKKLKELYPQLTADELEQLLLALQKSYVLTMLPPRSANARPSTRLAHDTLAPVVFTRWRKSPTPGPQARWLLEERAADWDVEKTTGRKLDAEKLAVVERGLGGMRKLTKAEEHLLAASRTSVRKQQYLVRGAAGIVIVSAVIAVGSGLEARAAGKRAIANSLPGNASILASQKGPDLQVAALLAAEALDLNWTPEVDAMARRILARMLVPVGIARQDGKIDSMAISPKGDFIATIRTTPSGPIESATLGITAIPSGEELKRLSLGDVTGLVQMHISEDASQIALKTRDAYWLYNWREGRPEQQIALKTNALEAVAFSKDNHWMAVRVKEGLAIYELPQQKPSRILKLDIGSIERQVQFSRFNPSQILVRENTGRFASIDVVTGEMKSQIPAQFTKSEIERETSRALPVTSDDIEIIDIKIRCALADDDDETNERLSAAPNAVGGFSLSPGGSILDLSPVTNIARYWRRLDNGEPAPINFLSNTGGSLIFSADDKRALAPHHPKGASILDLGTNETQLVKRNVFEREAGRPVALSMDGNFIVGSTGYMGNDTITLRNRNDPSTLWRSLHDKPARHQALTESFLITGGEDGRVITWALPGGQQDRLYRLPQSVSCPENMEPVTGRVLAESRYGNMAAVEQEGTVTVYDRSSGNKTLTVKLPAQAAERSISKWAIEEWVVLGSGQTTNPLFAGSDFIETVPIVVDARRPTAHSIPLSWNAERHVHIVENGADVALPDGIKFDAVRSITAILSPQGDRLALMWGDRVWIYDVTQQKPIAQFSLGYVWPTSSSDEHALHVNARAEQLLFNDDGSGLGIATERATLWSWTSGSSGATLGKRFYNRADRGSSHFFLDDVDGIAVVGWDGQQERVIEGGSSFMAASPGDSYIAMRAYVRDPSGVEGQVSVMTIRSIETDEKPLNIDYEPEGNLVAFSPDGHLVAIAGRDNGVRVWNIRTRTEVARLSAQENSIRSLRFVDSDVFWTSTNADARNLQPIGAKNLIAEICHRSIRNLTREEREKYLGDQNHRDICPDLRWENDTTTAE